MRKVLIKPLITEKMTAISEVAPKYGFLVDVDANKIEISKAVKNKFGVDCIAVNTIRYNGKRKTQFTRKGRFAGKKPRYKKAIVTLKPDQSIDFFGEV